MESSIACTEARQFHPLELIPFFRRFAPSRARNLVYTLILSALIAGAFLLVGASLQGRLPTLREVRIDLVIAAFVGLAIYALFQAGQMTGLQAIANRGGTLARIVYYTIIPTIGVIAGFQATDWVLGLGFASPFSDAGWMVSIVATNIVLTLIITAILYIRERSAVAQAALQEERARGERVQREAIAANLRALQAQIEPHFLFNTLANVASLVDRDPANAKRMLERFIGFLRASLAATRGERTTLGAERELIAAYLDVLQVRMGPRLHYSVDMAADVAQFPIPPMLLQPVVENAIRHGIEPKVEGGRIDVRARREGAAVLIEVDDTGVGFAPATQGGVGLANLRDRLRGLYGERSTLAIGEIQPAGTRVAIRIPA